jgi:hypothetical protein
MNVVEFLNDKKTFNKVIEILNQYGNISNIKNDFIAGGSVSNIIFHLLHGGKLTINDIDVYKKIETKKENIFGEVIEVSKSWYPSVYINEEGLEVLDDSYGRTYVSETGSRMQIVRHSRKGIFNNIDYLFHEGYYKSKNKVKKSKESVILEGFDLNCCKAGIDLVNQEIIYTPEFVEFLETKQMKVINPCAPFQTTIRIYKKLKDLDGITCDIKNEMLFLTVASKNIHGSQITKIIGPETKEKYDKVKPFVEQYFKLRKPDNINEVRTLGLNEKHFVNDKLNRDAKIWVYDPVLDFDLIEAVHNINTLKKTWELLYRTKDNFEQDKINMIFYKNIFLGDMKEDVWVRDVWEEGSNKTTKQPYYCSERFTYQMVLTKKGYYKSDFNINQVDYVDKFVKNNRGISFILNFCDTISNQYDIIKFIESIVEKEGEWVIAVLEDLDSNQRQKIESNGKITKELLLDILKFEKEVNSKEFINKLDITNFRFNSCVKELVTPIELKTESKKNGFRYSHMDFSENKRQSGIRVFQINYKGFKAMVEIKSPDTERYCHTLRKVCKIVEVHQLNNIDFGDSEEFGWTKNLVDKDSEEKCMVFYKDGYNHISEETELKEIVYRMYHNGIQSARTNFLDINFQITIKRIVRNLIEFLNKNHLPRNYHINLAKKEK